MSEDCNTIGPPQELAYPTEDELGEEYCCRIGYSECMGTVGESYEPSGYGCDGRDQWEAKYSDLVVGSELSEEEWATLAAEGEHKRADLFLRTEWEDEHPEDYDGPCLCRECLSYGE